MVNHNTFLNCSFYLIFYLSSTNNIFIHDLIKKKYIRDNDWWVKTWNKIQKKKKYKIVRVRGLFSVTPTRETHAADLYF